MYIYIYRTLREAQPPFAAGGTYMTMLNTLSNLGGQWPGTLVLATKAAIETLPGSPNGFWGALTEYEYVYVYAFIYIYIERERDYGVNPIYIYVYIARERERARERVRER